MYSLKELDKDESMIIVRDIETIFNVEIIFNSLKGVDVGHRIIQIKTKYVCRLTLMKLEQYFLTKDYQFRGIKNSKGGFYILFDKVEGDYFC